MCAQRLTKSIIAPCVFLILFTECLAQIITRNDWVLQTTSELSSTRWRLLWSKTHTNTAVTDYKIDTYHPLLGWYPLKNAKNVSVGKYVVNFNADGIRGEKIYAKNKQPGITRIVVVGDSFTFGEGVNDDETYPAQLEKIMPNTEVLNLGVHGYGLDQMSLRLHLDGFTYHPDIVIYAFIGGDIDRTALSFRDYMKPQYALVNGRLHLLNVPIPSPNDLIRRFRYRPAMLDLFLLLRDRVVFRNNQDAGLEPLVNAIWKQTVEDIKRHGALPIFVYLPAGTDMNYSEESPNERLMFLSCQSLHITCFSARPDLRQAHNEGVKYNINAHYEPLTNTIIAEGLAHDLGGVLLNASASGAQPVL